MADSSAIPVVNPVPSAGDTEAFETDESAPTPRSPQIRIPFTQTRLRRARKTIRLEPPMSPSMEARIADMLACTSTPLSSTTTLVTSITSDSLTTTTTSTIITIFTTTYTHIITVTIITTTSLIIHTTTKVGESSSAAPRPTRGHRADYGFISIMGAEIRPPTTLKGVNARMTELAAVQEQDIPDVYSMIEDTQDRQTQLFQRVDGLVKDRQFHYETARLLDWEALISREA
ncbi:hypothetical protein Tco_0535539 [Tanacetum coccineum]